MNSRTILSVTLVVFIAVLGTAAFTAQNNTTTVTTSAPLSPSGSVATPAGQASATPPNSSTAQKTPAATGYTLAQVATHNSAASCWAAINGNVYNLTAWINQHPGGPGRILALCGTDGSAAFNGQHGGQARPASELKSFLIGPLQP